MIRSSIGVKLTAVAVAVVTTAGVAAATTLPNIPPANVAVQPSIEAEVTPTDLPDLPEVTVPTLPDASAVLATLGSGGTPSLPKVPGLPPLSEIPGLSNLGTGGLPVDPAIVAGPIVAAASDVADLLPTPAQLQVAVRHCVAKLAALAPVSVASAGDPISTLIALLTSLSQGGPSVPTPPSAAKVQAAVTACITELLSVLPDPAELASAITTKFGGSLPGPVGDMVAILMGELGSLPDPQHMLDLIGALSAATGSPGSLFQDVVDAIDDILPPELSGLLALPLSIVHQVFAALGLG